MIPPAEFEAILEKAGELTELVREYAAGKSLAGPNASETTVKLHEETLTLQLSMMATIQNVELPEKALFTSLGDLSGSLLAQAINTDHVELMRIMFSQMRSTFEQVTEAARPVGNA